MFLRILNLKEGGGGASAAGTIFIFSGWCGPEITYVIFQRYSRQNGEQTMSGKLAVIALNFLNSTVRPNRPIRPNKKFKHLSLCHIFCVLICQIICVVGCTGECISEGRRNAGFKNYLCLLGGWYSTRFKMRITFRHYLFILFVYSIITDYYIYSLIPIITVYQCMYRCIMGGDGDSNVAISYLR